MVTNYYNASNNFSAPIRREPRPYMAHPEKRPEKKEEIVLLPDEKMQINEKDTLLILGLILLLFMSGCEDILLILALFYLLLF